MNPLYRTAAENTDGGPLLATTTVLFLAYFIGWVLWAYWPSNASMLAEYGRMPLDDDEPPKGGA